MTALHAFHRKKNLVSATWCFTRVKTCLSNSSARAARYQRVHRATNLCLKNCAGAVPACAAEVVFDVAALRVQTEMAMKSLAAGANRIFAHAPFSRST